MKRLAVSLATFILRALYLAVHTLVGPRKQLLCLSRQSDNAPVDFTLIRSYIREHYPDYRVVIMAKKLSNPLSYLFHMLAQTYEVATSEAILLDSYCIVVSLLNKTIEAPVIQLWHAMGNMKRFGYAALDEPEGRSTSTAKLMHMHEGYDCVVISSLSFIDDYVAGFHVDPCKVFESPLPRTDLLIDPDIKRAKREKILDRYPKLRDKSNIVYCPTFRKPPRPEDSAAIEQLAACVDFSKYNLIYKAHPVSTLSFTDDRVFQDYDRSLDMLYIADYVISDYSTVIYEAGLLKIPVYLYTYDWDTYSQRRGLNIDFTRDVPAPSSPDPRILIEAIENATYDRNAFDTFIARNIALPKKGSCTKHIVDHVFSLMK